MKEKKHKHFWIVFSTAIEDHVLMVFCECGDYGIVRNPTREEWSLAFIAPSEPYPWVEGDERVEIVPNHTTAIHPVYGVRTIVYEGG